MLGAKDPPVTDRSLSTGDTCGDNRPGIDPEAGLAAYAGRWVALIGGQVAGVGHTAEAARLAARRSRPRERIGQVYFVWPDLAERPGDPSS